MNETFLNWKIYQFVSQLTNTFMNYVMLTNLAESLFGMHFIHVNLC